MCYDIVVWEINCTCTIIICFPESRDPYLIPVCCGNCVICGVQRLDLVKMFQYGFRDWIWSRISHV